MNLFEIASDEYYETDPDTELGPLRSTLESDGVDGVLVTDSDGIDVTTEDVVGVVTPRDLVRSHFDDDTKASTAATAVPHLDQSDDVREAARLLVENQTRIAPVFERGDLWGVVTQDDLVAGALDSLDVLTVGDVQTQDVVAINRDETVGDAIDRLRDNDISRLPVVDDEGYPVGIVTTSDIVEFTVRDASAADLGDRRGEKPRLLELPVDDFMSRPVETIEPEDSVASAVERMLEGGSDGLVVSPAYTDLVAGIVTKTDVLRALTVTDDDTLDLQVVNADLLRTTTRDDVADRLAEVTDKHQEMDLIEAQVRFQRHVEQLRGESLVRCVVRVWTDEAQLAGTGEGYGADNALELALDTLERNVLDHKSKRSDRQHRARVLQKLDRL